MAIQIQKVSSLILKFFPSLLAKSSPEDHVERQIGLNVGRSGIVACEVALKGEKLVLERVIRKEIVKNKPLGNQLKDLLLEAKFESKQVNVSLKGQGIVV